MTSMSQECDRCHRQFDTRQHLLDHLARKKPCHSRELEEYRYNCDKCSKLFKHQSSACRHRVKCAQPTVQQQLTIAQGQIADAQRQIADLNRQMTGMGHTTHIGDIHNDNRVDNRVDNSVNSVIQVNIKAYGCEENAYLEDMTYAQLKRILQLSPDNESLLNMIKLIHKNKDHPENNNIKLDSKDSETINIFKNRAWNAEKTDPTIYDLICRSRLRFIDVEPQLTSGMAKKKLEALNSYLEKAEDMSNSEDSTMYPEFAFTDLISQVKDVFLQME